MGMLLYAQTHIRPRGRIHPWRASRAQVPLAAVLAQVDAVDATRCQQLVLGEAPLDHPDLDPRAFASGLAALQRAIGPHKLPFNPMVGRRTPWVDEGKLHRAISAHKRRPFRTARRRQAVTFRSGGCAIA